MEQIVAAIMAIGAVVGYVRGRVNGLVRDVADLRARVEKLEERKHET